MGESVLCGDIAHDINDIVVVTSEYLVRQLGRCGSETNVDHLNTLSWLSA